MRSFNLNCLSFKYQKKIQQLFCHTSKTDLILLQLLINFSKSLSLGKHQITLFTFFNINIPMRATAKICSCDIKATQSCGCIYAHLKYILCMYACSLNVYFRQLCQENQHSRTTVGNRPINSVSCKTKHKKNLLNNLLFIEPILSLQNKAYNA